MVLSLQGRSHRFKSCSAHKGFSEIFTYLYSQKTPKRHPIIYYEIMKYKKDLGGFLVLLGLTWQVFSVLDSSYTPTQVILTVIFAYLGVRLTYFVYFKNN